uniref:carbonyl reductase (NADPH) n=1 Tax=Neogobius melanostomus TaxID=47308 RepID=A0A8C6UAS0_9GOBI
MTSKVAVVTGSNKGIGLAIVRALCKQFEGDVYLTARDLGRGEEAVKILTSEGLKPKFQQLDITDVSSITSAAAFFRETYGGVDILVNNAGIAFKPATPFSIQAEVTLKTNFFATRDVLTHFMPLIKSGGRVVNVSSFMGSLALNLCSEEFQQRFRSEDITEDELVGLMERFVEKTKTGEHKKDGWPELVYGVSKTGLTVLSHSQEVANAPFAPLGAGPGWVRTDMAGDKAPKSPDEGAVIPVYLALLPPGATEPHGCFVTEKGDSAVVKSFTLKLGLRELS